MKSTTGRETTMKSIVTSSSVRLAAILAAAAPVAAFLGNGTWH
jgi:hypothetical protein